MIQVTKNIWIGDSVDEIGAKVGAILNVAIDLPPTRGWGQKIDYLHVGLVDGPGNLPVAYCAAVLALQTLHESHDQVLVCCHSGGRSLAVVLMYMHLVARCGWMETIEMVQERIEDKLPEVNPAHQKAFHKINWQHLRDLVKE